MAVELRKTGISVVGDAPWGTHFCQFYETKQDLLDTLVPYFKAGLESKEFCLWVVSNPELITVEEAKAALAKAVPDLDRHFSEENIEILNGHDWYLKEDVFNLERVTRAWDAKLKRALARGYDGMRVSGDTFWLAEKDWEDFFAYEKQLNDSITDQPMTVLCTYPLAKSGAAEVLDVVQAHQFAIARRQGKWEVIETPELIQAKAEIRRLNAELQRIVKTTQQPPLVLRYGVAVLAVIAALIINRLLHIHLVGAPAMLFLCALMFSAWYGGVKPSLLALPLATLAFAYYFVTPMNSWTIDVREIPRLCLFVLSALFVISLSAAQKRAAESLKRARDVLAGTVEELKRTNQALRTENTERKQAESLLHAKEQEFRAIVENAPDQIIRYDREFRRTYVNPAVAKAYGLPPEALLGKPIGSVIQDVGLDVREDELEQVRQRIASVFDTGKSYESEISWPLPTGRRYFSSRLFPELDLNGSVVNVLGISRDITDRRQAEEKVKQSESQLAEAQRLAHIGSWSLDLRSYTVTWSDELYRIFGVQPTEFDHNYEAVLGTTHPEDRDWLGSVIENAIKTHEPFNVYYRITQPTGEVRVLHAHGAVVTDEHRNATRLHGTAQDVTERNRAEEQLKATSEQLRALSASVQSAREQEAAHISREIHDELGSALTSLRLDLELVKREQLPSTSEADLSRVREKIESMMQLIDETADTVRRISSELRPSVLDDLGLVAAIRWQAQQFERQSGILCDCDCRLENLDLDQHQSTAIFRVLQGALTNVLRHAEATRVDIILEKEDDELVLTIEDNGRGITAEEKSNPQSLGLLGMRERVKLIGGVIEITGVEGKGTVIAVRVPIHRKAL